MCFFCFKQKTAYELRISDWSSYVCSSDLSRRRPRLSPGRRTSKRQLEARRQRQTAGHLAHFLVADAVGLVARVVEGGGKQVLEHLLFGRDHQAVVNGDRLRSEERRVGKEGVRSCIFRWSPVPLQKQ